MVHSAFIWKCYFSKKIESIGKMTAMTQEEIVSSTKTVVQGLDALRSEHTTILTSLNSSVEAALQEQLDSRLMQEKVGLVSKSLEMIELGLGEAQVSYKF